MEAVFALAVALAGVAGIAFAPLLEQRRALHSAGLAFSAGTLLSVILLHVMPEAMALTPQASLLFVGGFVGMMTLHQHGLKADPCCGHEHARHAGLPSFLALSLCSVNDGLVLVSDLDRGLASPLLWAMCVHAATASFALLMLLREVGGLRDRRAVLPYMAAFLAVTPLAILLASQLKGLGAVWSHALALAAGALLYVIGGSLVPRVEHLAREGRGAVLITFLAAVLVNVCIQLTAPHTHTAHAHEHQESSK